MINPADRIEILREYGHRQVNRLIMEEHGPAAQLILSHFPGTYDAMSWARLWVKLEADTRTLSDWLEDQS